MITKKYFAMKDPKGEIQAESIAHTIQDVVYAFGFMEGYCDLDSLRALGYDVVEVKVEEVKTQKIIMFQEAICPKGLGRVVAEDSDGRITIQMYVYNNQWKWARTNVELIDPRTG